MNENNNNSDSSDDEFNKKMAAIIKEKTINTSNISETTDDDTLSIGATSDDSDVTKTLFDDDNLQQQENSMFFNSIINDMIANDNDNDNSNNDIDIDIDIDNNIADNNNNIQGNNELEVDIIAKTFPTIGSLESFIKLYSSKQGFPFKRSYTYTSLDGNKTVVRGKYNCIHKCDNGNCSFVIHFGSKTEPGANIPFEYKINKSSIQHTTTCS
jgi:hypothetical protein